MAFAPGTESVREAGILLRRGDPARAWCLDCWRSAFGPAAAVAIKRAPVKRGKR